MKQTKLIEFKSHKGYILRGILIISDKTKNKGVIFCHGFERASSTEKKFKILSDELIKYNISSFRFDYAGCGLSDGDFRFTTIKNMVKYLERAKCTFQDKTKINKICIVAHSLSACVVSNYINKKDKLPKIVLISPALNQKDLLRFWFVKNSKPKINITWNNYRKYLDEKEFVKDCYRNKMTKSNYINKDYFIENKDRDYSNLFDSSNDSILHIHGDNDEVIPLESLNIKFKNRIIVKNSDHDLERLDMMNQWLNKTVDFIKK